MLKVWRLLSEKGRCFFVLNPNVYHEVFGTQLLSLKFEIWLDTEEAQDQA